MAPHAILRCLVTSVHPWTPRTSTHPSLIPHPDIKSLSSLIRFRVDRVNLAAARQTHKYFWRPPCRLQSVFGGRHTDSRVFLAAANLTLESFWSRFIIACYPGATASSQYSNIQ
ncbi:hypothetical protein PoB_001502000 [Plakobranchus ocellatus]|uniref:Uncharacterized protein n=1 Tax=Plakobranchus ocellatus TaxID=259542 RepID=A0AAV3YZY7_9GAST|nr:hypothetical protein PoB_001502000 [Plakobranchus ocellatus]